MALLYVSTYNTFCSHTQFFFGKDKHGTQIGKLTITDIKRKQYKPKHLEGS